MGGELHEGFGGLKGKVDDLLLADEGRDAVLVFNFKVLGGFYDIGGFNSFDEFGSGGEV